MTKLRLPRFQMQLLVVSLVWLVLLPTFTLSRIVDIEGHIGRNAVPSITDDSRPAFDRCKDEEIRKLLLVAETGNLAIDLNVSLDDEESYHVKLTANDVISGLALLALYNGDPVGTFGVPRKTSSTNQVCLPGRCVGPNDAVVCLEMSQTQESINLIWTAPYGMPLKDVTFKYVVVASNCGERSEIVDGVKQVSSHQGHNVFMRQTSNTDTPYLVVANRRFIREVTLDGRSFKTIVTGLSNAQGLSYHYKEDSLYWADVDRKLIMRSSLDGSNPTTMVDTAIERPEDLAVDWVTNKLYWVESPTGLNHTIQVLDLSTGARNTELILTGSGSNPRSLVVDPGTGWLYWSDWGSPAQIQRASMDGQNVETIQSGNSANIMWPYALTVDYDSQILYWADAFFDTISSSPVEPGSPITLITSAASGYVRLPYSIVTLQETLFFTDWFNGVSSLHTSGTNYSTLTPREAQFLCNQNPYGIELVTSQRQAEIDNPCAINNGGCGVQELCLLNSLGHACVQSSDTSTIAAIGSCSAVGYTTCCSNGDCQGQPANCHCDANCVLFRDCCSDAPTSCLSPGSTQPFLAVTSEYSLHYLSLDGQQVTTSVSGLDGINEVDYHFRLNSLYWVDSGGISRSPLDGTRTFPVSTSPVEGLSIAVDWLSDKLYYGGGSVIMEVMDIQMGYRISFGPPIESVLSLVVDPVNRILYWITSAGSCSSSIWTASMDGNNRTQLYCASEITLGLNLDHLNQVLYWATEASGEIWSMSIDGANLMVLSQVSSSLHAIAEWNTSLYWSDNNGVHSITKDGSSTTTLITSLCSTIRGLAVIIGERQQSGVNPCGQNNGGCNKLCLLSAVNPDGFTCVNDGVQDPPPPLPIGSCIDTGYSSCCDVGQCRGLPTESYCYCDAGCYNSADCCGDINQTCPPIVDPVVITDHPSDQLLIVPGESAAFTIVAMGDSPRYQWQKDGIYIPGANSVTFTIATVTESDEGEYQCVVSNAANNVTSNAAKLTVVDPPMILNQQNGTNPRPATTGERVSFMVVATGDLLVYQWQRNGVDILGATSITFTIATVVESDMGDYQCVVSNAAGTTVSQAVQLIVCLAVTPTIIIMGEVAELSTLTLLCQFGGFPLPSLVWLRRIEQEVQTIDFLVMSSRARVNSTTEDSLCLPIVSSTLQISTVTEVDNGEYICTNINSDFITAVQVHINVPSIDNCVSVPCKNNGNCSDRVGGYECVCDENFIGTDCTGTVGPVPVQMPNITQPPQEETPALAQPVNLTCEAQGYPPPLYHWFQDGVKIPGDTLPYLYIREVAPGDRGNYSCTATNRAGSVTSSPGLLRVKDVYQFIVEADFDGNLVEELALKTVRTTTNNVTIYSMRTLSSTTSTASLLVTVLSSSGSTNIRSALSIRLSGAISNVIVNPLQIYRYDGCPEESIPLLTSSLLTSGDTSITYTWPETEIGDPVVYQLCPNQEASNTNDNVSRYCGGSYSSGAEWSDVDLSACGVWTAEILDNITSQPEILEADAVSETVLLIEEVLTDAAIADPMVAVQYLNIIDNLQQVNESVVQESEGETGVSERILNSIGRFQDEVALPPNTTTPIVYARESFAIQVQDVSAETFSGEALNVDLGSFEEALRLNTSIPVEALLTTMEALVNVTASIAVPSSLLTDLQSLEEGIARRALEFQRLSYSVFLTDILFLSPNQSANNLSIGTIILALRLRNITLDQILKMPLNTTFRFSNEVQGARSSNCVHWESSAKFGEWSSRDCEEVKQRDGEITCQCRRPSAHFAILFDLNPAVPPDGVATALEVITYIGLAVSMISLILMIITYFYSKNLRNSIHGQIILNICFALFGLYFFFLIAAHITSVTWLCGLVSALLHYFILVFFAWTAAEATYLYIKLVKVLGVDKYERGFTWKAGLVTWLIPAVIVIISLAGYQYYTSSYYCRPTQWPFFFGLILPFVLVYIFNWVMFFIITVSIFTHTRKHSVIGHKEEGSISRKLRAIRHNVIIAIALSLVFGLGWGLGLLATSTRVIGITTAFQVIFTLFVGGQGLLLLIFHGIRSDKAKEVWRQWISLAMCSHKKAYSVGVSTSDTAKRATGPTAGMSSSPSTASYALTTLNRTGNPSSCIDDGASHKADSVFDAEALKCSVIEKVTTTFENDHDKQPYCDLQPFEHTYTDPTSHTLMDTNPAYGKIEHTCVESAEQSLPATAMYEEIDRDGYYNLEGGSVQVPVPDGEEFRTYEVIGGGGHGTGEKLTIICSPSDTVASDQGSDA